MEALLYYLDRVVNINIRREYAYKTEEDMSEEDREVLQINSGFLGKLTFRLANVEKRA